MQLAKVFADGNYYQRS